MNHSVVRGDQFIADVYSSARWYAAEAGSEVATNFQVHVEATLARVARNPTIGRQRHFRDPVLRGLRSIRVEPPFGKILVFYRIEQTTVYVFRLIHGARDLGRRLLEFGD